MFPARFDKQEEDDHALDEIEFHFQLNIKRNLAQSVIDNIHVRSQLERQIQNQELKDSCWRFDRINLMTRYF